MVFHPPGSRAPRVLSIADSEDANGLFRVLVTPRLARSPEAVCKGPGHVSPYLNSRRKRALDVIGAASLLLFFLPALLLIGALVWTTSGAPILFRQERCGRNRRPFTIYKFRSMTASPEEDGTVRQASRCDARVTSLGRILRRTSLDEIPQLVNVLQGQMSLVGPRPHVTCHDAYYGARIPRYGDRFAVRPGLSGMAQINGCRGETPRVADMERRVELDLAYIRSATLLGDLRILAATALEMLFSSTAY
jgi:putative colanic acid biosynthesis UDP-glucose lipid carrier transferase